MYEIICIGASWGGLHAVGRVLQDIPEEVDVPIVVAQHRHPNSIERTLAELLHLRSKRVVVGVEDKTPLERGGVYLSPPDYHVLVQRGSLALSLDDRVQYSRPSIDVLFESAAYAYGPAAIGIILTGANEDGAAGLAMPDAAIAATAADAILPLEEIGKFLYGLCVKSVGVRERTEA